MRAVTFLAGALSFDARGFRRPAASACRARRLGAPQVILQGFALRGEVLSQRWESTQRIAGERLRMSAFALIFALSPDPFYGGYFPNPRWSSSGAWNLEWTVPTPTGPLGPGAVDSGRGWSSPPAPPAVQPTLRGGGGYHSLNHRGTCAPPHTKARLQTEEPLHREIHLCSGSGGGGNVNPYPTRAFAKTTRGA